MTGWIEIIRNSSIYRYVLLLGYKYIFTLRSSLCHYDSITLNICLWIFRQKHTYITTKIMLLHPSIPSLLKPNTELSIKFTLLLLVIQIDAKDYKYIWWWSILIFNSSQVVEWNDYLPLDENRDESEFTVQFKIRKTKE